MTKVLVTTCDKCSAQKPRDDEQLGWDQVTTRNKTYDLCPKCFIVVLAIIPKALADGLINGPKALADELIKGPVDDPIILPGWTCECGTWTGTSQGATLCRGCGWPRDRPRGL